MSEAELTQLMRRIEVTLSEELPGVELLALERAAAERLRLVIDRDGGVDLALCENVTKLLRDLNDEWALEVASPGPERPLTKPEHFRRYLGSRVRVRTREEIEGHRSFTGTLTAADDVSVSVDSGSGPLVIPLAAVRRSNLLPEAEVAA